MIVGIYGLQNVAIHSNNINILVQMHSNYVKDELRKTNEAKRGLMKPPVPKSLNILYFILTFTSEIFIYSLKFKKLWM